MRLIDYASQKVQKFCVSILSSTRNSAKITYPNQKFIHQNYFDIIIYQIGLKMRLGEHYHPTLPFPLCFLPYY